MTCSFKPFCLFLSILSTWITSSSHTCPWWTSIYLWILILKNSPSLECFTTPQGRVSYFSLCDCPHFGHIPSRAMYLPYGSAGSLSAFSSKWCQILLLSLKGLLKLYISYDNKTAFIRRKSMFPASLFKIKDFFFQRSYLSGYILTPKPFTGKYSGITMLS